METMTERVNQSMREGQQYTTSDIAELCGISKQLAGECLRSLWRGMLVERYKLKVGETSTGKDIKLYHYQTKQKDLM